MGDAHAHGSKATARKDARAVQSDSIPFHAGTGAVTPVVSAQGTQQIPLDLLPYNGGPIRRGICVIFNNKVFQSHTKLGERTGTEADERDLENCFKQFGFNVHKYRDLTGTQTKAELKKLGQDDYTVHDCFVCCFLSHGTEDDFICASDGAKIPVDEITKHFRGDKCRSLVGKPKLFFLQACRGKKAQRGVPLDRSDTTGAGVRIPTHADFLVAYSTVPGFLSWRHMDRGSWFIQTLCCVLQEMAGSTDILHVLTLVCKRVALMPEFQAWMKEDGEVILAKQMPTFMSTLTSLVFFSNA